MNYKILIWILSTVLVIKVLLDIFTMKYIDLSMKENEMNQARMNLDRIQNCVVMYLWEKEKNVSLVQEALDICASNSLVWWPTGDVFAIDLRDMSLLWDASSDCKLNEKAYLTEDSICKLASDPESCVWLSKEIAKWYNWEYTWRFDDSDERSTWIVSPNLNIWYHWNSKWLSYKKDVFQIAIVHWVQKDEVDWNSMIACTLLKIVTYLWNFILLFSVVFLAHIINSKICKRQSE